MKHPTRHTTLLLVLCILFAFPALGGDAPAPGAEEKAGPDMAAMMEAMKEARTPGEHHHFLAGLEGEWTFTNTMWMDPSQPPMKSEGASTKAMILGGRYLQEETSGDVMGDVFHGRAVTAYDNTTGEFVSTWIDDMGTGVMVSRGQRDGNTLTMHGDYVDPMSKQPAKVRMVTRIVDGDRHVFEYYMTMPGAPEFKSMEIEYVRKAGD